MFKDKRKDVERQEKSRVLEQQMVKLLWPVLVSLKRKLDRRLVSTFLGFGDGDHHASSSQPRLVME